MEDGDAYSPEMMANALPDSAMDLDYFNDLLLDGCWLETADGSEFIQLSPTSAAAFYDPPFQSSVMEISNGDMSICQSPKKNQEERGQSKNTFDLSPVSELNKKLWIEPCANPGSVTSVMQRLIWALDCIRKSRKDKDVLIQLWLPVNQGGKRVLTTNHQPFSVESNCQRLTSYREISVHYNFSAEEDSKNRLGLPGRVFLGKVPEWSPDVRLFRKDEYPRVNDAQRYDVRGTIALPVFELGSGTCIGVIEVVTTIEKIKYRTEIDSVCKALEAVDLRSSQVPSITSIKNASCKSYQFALPEILELFKCACETHRLPLAQTWIPCIQQEKDGYRHSDETYLHCISTVDHACYIADPKIQNFHEACSEHHLLKGQGVAGAAFLTNQPCFSDDITSYTKTEYPLAHHAKMFGLCGAVAIRLRSIHASTDDFVLEFFLPSECREPEEQKNMLSVLSIIIQKICRTLRVVTDKELEQENGSPVSDALLPSDGKEKFSGENSSSPTRFAEVQENGNVVLSTKEKPIVVVDEDVECREHEEDFGQRESVEHHGDSTFREASMSKRGEKRRTKAEKIITLQVLQQYFAGSLKDAAKSIGVCPTTLKRICRQHGIKRWPSRKIKKVGHSLHKLQLVMDSVQGASGAAALQIGSFYKKFPELASPNLSGTNPFSSSKETDHPNPPGMLPDGCHFSPQAPAASKSPSSSCSQSSNSSQCCSSGTQQQQPSLFNVSSTNEDHHQGRESSGGDSELKRAKSDAELHALSQQGVHPLPRSQSQRTLMEQNNLKHLPEINTQVSEEVSSHRVKVTYGNEIIRLRLPNDWGFSDLQREIARRFQIDDMSRYDMKYLDDESEWVLLTCDSDLDECIDVCQSSHIQTIKLLLQLGKS